MAARRAEVQKESAALEQAQADFKAQQDRLEKRIASVGQGPVTESDVEKARIDMETVEVDVASAQMDLVAAKHQVEALQTQIGDAQDRLNRLQAGAGQDAQALAAAQAELQQKQALLALEQQHVENLGRRLDLAQSKAEGFSRLWQALQDAYRSRQALERKESLADLEQRLQRAQQAADQKAAALRSRLSQISGDDMHAVAKRHLLTIQIEQAMDEVFLLRSLLALEQARNALQGLPVAAPDAGAAPAELARSIELLDGIEKGLQPILVLIQRKLALFNHEIELLRRNSAIEKAGGEQQYRIEKDALRSLIDRFQGQADALSGLMDQVKSQRVAFQEAYKAASARSLTSRQRLPRDPQTWVRIGTELEHLPATLGRLVASIALDLRGAWLRSNLLWRLMVVAFEIFWLGFMLWLGRLGRPSGADLEAGQSFSAKTRTVSLALLRGLSWSLLPGGALVLAGWLLGLAPQDLKFLLLLAVVAVGGHLMIGLSHWVFVSPLIPSEKRQPTVHRGVVGITLAIALLVVLDGLGHLGHLSAELWQLVQRVFMILLLPLASLSLRLRRLLMARLREQWSRLFWVNLLGLASFVVPLVVLTASVVGLAGYINLAWFLAARLGLILLVFLVWAVLRHLVIDLAAVLRGRAQTRPQRAGLLIGGLIEPGQAIARLLLFLGAMWSLGAILGWGSGTGIGGLLRAWLDHPLFSIGGAPIDLLDIFGALIYLGITIYFGIWIRRLTFDWLYIRIRDQGLRNSLAIFSQYAIILLGVLIGLNLLHINLTSLTVFAGALGVGIGLGLQNIANNFVSGLILLMERPVRILDWVTISDHEGKVSRIGMRSLTVTTWDNQDVIIPNADLISNPFTNWTLSDALVRTLFVVGIRYQDDPHRAQQVILDAVAMQPEVSLERRPRVLLVEFNSSSVDFRVEFYTDVGQFSRLEVKSKVMFAIWDALQEADIGIPFPQRDIYIKELPEQHEAAGPALSAPPPSQSGAG